MFRPVFLPCITTMSLFGDSSQQQQRLDLDRLFDKKQRADQEKLKTFNHILSNVDRLIKKTARDTPTKQCCMFAVPKIIYGLPRFNQTECIAFCIERLRANQLAVQFVPPHSLFVSWMNYMPSYVREQIREKTGISVDEFGRPIAELEPADVAAAAETKQDTETVKKQPAYTPTSMYKPTGRLIYNPELMSKISARVNGRPSTQL